MQLSKRQAVIMLGGILALVLGYFVLTSGRRDPLPPIEMKVWGTDPSPYMDGILQGYKAARPNVTIAYQYIEPDGYEEKVLNALASGSGPDVFMIGAHDVPKQKSKLVPVDPIVFGLAKLQDLFPTVVEQDVVSGTDIYALPLYSDTLALIYNKDFFDAASIAVPPKTWTAFQDAVTKLRTLNANGQIERAGAALGGSARSVPHAADIVYALMLQKGTTMTNANGATAAFGSDSGLEALNFYLRFADATSAYYTWNDTMPTAIDSMASGKAAMMIGYKSDLDALKQRAPFLSAGVAALPQAEGASQPVTYADYKSFAVSRQSLVAWWGWDFTVFAATNNEAHKGYLAVSGRAPMLRDVIDESVNDVKVGVFAKQAFIARSWYQVDATKIADAFDRAIRNVLNGTLDASRALRQAQETVSQLMR